MKKLFNIVVTLILVILFIIPTTSSAKSVYVLSHCNSNSAPIQAYDIQGANIVYQSTVNTNFGWGGCGLAIDTDSKVIFMTQEGRGYLKKIDAETFADLGTQNCPGANNLAGVVVDQDNGLVYAIQRTYYGRPAALYIYDLNFNPINQITISEGGVGLALDEINDLLYITNFSSTVSYYDTATWIKQGSFHVSHSAVGITIDSKNGLVYTGAWYYSSILSKYDLNTQSEVTLNIGTGVVGLAVDPSTGFLYITTFRDDLRVYDLNLTMTDKTGDIGDPAGLCIPGKDISYNPLSMSKSDGLEDTLDDCIGVGGQVTYSICYGSSNHDVTNVVVTDTIPADTVFVSATGAYNLNAGVITWDIGTISAGAPDNCVSVVLQIGEDATPGGLIHNNCTIISDQTPPTTQGDDTVVCLNQPPIASIVQISDVQIPLPVDIKVTPRTLNLSRLGRWVKAHICENIYAIQAINIVLDGSESSDPDGDYITYDWTIIGPEGEICVDSEPVINLPLSDGNYSVTLIVNDGMVDSNPVTMIFTLTDQTLADLATGDYTLNGIPDDIVKGNDCIVISFDDDAIAATVEIGPDQELLLGGTAVGADYIDVIKGGKTGSKGKSGPKFK